MARLGAKAWVIANFTCTEVALGNADHSNAIVPLTKGVATLVPPIVAGLPSVPRLVMDAPGARSPRLPTELPKFDSLIGLPCASQATTGMTHGCRVITVLPSVP